MDAPNANAGDTVTGKPFAPQAAAGDKVESKSEGGAAAVAVTAAVTAWEEWLTEGLGKGIQVPMIHDVCARAHAFEHAPLLTRTVPCSTPAYCPPSVACTRTQGLGQKLRGGQARKLRLGTLAWDHELATGRGRAAVVVGPMHTLIDARYSHAQSRHNTQIGRGSRGDGVGWGDSRRGRRGV